MKGESEAIQRCPPGGTGAAATNLSNTAANCQSLALSAGVSSGATNVAAGGGAPGGGNGNGKWYSFRNIGTVEAHIRFFNVDPGVATVNDWPIPAQGMDEFWCTDETQFRAICAANSTLFWYPSNR